MGQKTQRSYCKNNLQKNIFSKRKEPKIIIPEEFKTLNKIGFGTFGEIYKVIWSQNNEKYAMKTIFTKNKDNILYIQEKTKLIIDFQKKTKCDGLIKIFGDTYIKKEEDYHYYVIMEIAERDWEKEINRRKHDMLYYSERELFLIMSQLIKTLSLLQKNHITHRDIKLQNILLIKNKFKICDFGEARKLVQKGTIVQPVRGSELYMSPIQFYGLNHNLKLVQHNTYKSDVFSLGMCILFAATLSDNCLYDIRELTNMNIIMEILERYLRKRYSIGFIRLLSLLLEVDERKRPDFIQLENIIFQITKNN
jgi:serine/threonine protein kinase